jgi:hypothetical protein
VRLARWEPQKHFCEKWRETQGSQLAPQVLGCVRVQRSLGIPADFFVQMGPRITKAILKKNEVDWPSLSPGSLQSCNDWEGVALASVCQLSSIATVSGQRKRGKACLS